MLRTSDTIRAHMFSPFNMHNLTTEKKALYRFPEDKIFNKVALMRSKQETELPDSRARSTLKDWNNGTSTPLQTDTLTFYECIIMIIMNI
jgi:hypothetical protein